MMDFPFPFKFKIGQEVECVWVVQDHRFFVISRRATIIDDHLADVVYRVRVAGSQGILDIIELKEIELRSGHASQPASAVSTVVAKTFYTWFMDRVEEKDGHDYDRPQFVDAVAELLCELEPVAKALSAPADETVVRGRYPLVRFDKLQGGVLTLKVTDLLIGTPDALINDECVRVNCTIELSETEMKIAKVKIKKKAKQEN